MGGVDSRPGGYDGEDLRRREVGEGNIVGGSEG